MTRAVFLDRDGTLNVEKDYLRDPAELEILPGVPDALKQLQDGGFKLFIVTNQSGIGRGYYTLEDMHRVNTHLTGLLASHGVRFEKIYFASEAPEAPSRGRKPSPQFLFDARDEFGVDLAESYMIGDKLIDLECGWNAGVKQSILVRTGYGAKIEQEAGNKLGPAIVVNDLAEVANLILRQANSPSLPAEEREALFRKMEDKGWTWRDKFIHAPNSTIWFHGSSPWQGDLHDFHYRMAKRLEKLPKYRSCYSTVEHYQRVFDDTAGLVAILKQLVDSKK